jgi:hypothetical protein
MAEQPKPQESARDFVLTIELADLAEAEKLIEADREFTRAAAKRELLAEIAECDLSNYEALLARLDDLFAKHGR